MEDAALYDNVRLSIDKNFVGGLGWSKELSCTVSGLAKVGTNTHA